MMTASFTWSCESHAILLSNFLVLHFKFSSLHLLLLLHQDHHGFIFIILFYDHFIVCYISFSSNSFGSIDAPSEDLCVMKVSGASWYPTSWDPIWNDLISYASYSSPWYDSICWVSSWSNSDSDYVSTIWRTCCCCCCCCCWPTAAPFRYSFCCCCDSTTSLITLTDYLVSLYHSLSGSWFNWNQLEDQMKPLHASSTS